MFKNNIPISNSSQKKLKPHEKRISDQGSHPLQHPSDSRGYASTNLRSSVTNKSAEDFHNPSLRQHHERSRVKEYNSNHT
jgi:hypothetical protein